MRVCGRRRSKNTKARKTKGQDKMMIETIPMLAAAAEGAAVVGDSVQAAAAGVRGSITLGIAGGGAGIGVGLVGLGAAQSVGRNPTAFGKILTISLIGMALAEAIAIYALILALGGS
jgi:F-type H+-transporting ATPase subunit c